MANTKTILVRTIGLLFSCSLLLTGCSGSYSSHMDEMLNESVCEEDAPYRVGPKREVILFLKHHIMVGGVASDIGQRETTEFTRTRQHRIPWESDRLSSYRKKTIPDLVQGVNEIFYDNDTNVFLVTDTVEMRIDDQFSPAEFSLLAKPQGHTRQAMEEVVAEEPGYIHILYGWTSSTTLLAAGEDLVIVVADDPRYGSRITSLDLAREIINSLGYNPQVDEYGTNTLMHHDTSGDGLSDEQVENIWRVINNSDQSLRSLSCTPRNKDEWLPAEPSNSDK